MTTNKVSKFMQGLFTSIGLKKQRLTMVDLMPNLLPVEIGNTDNNYKMGNPKMNTTDYVYVHSLEDFQKLPEEERCMTATAYAIGNGISVYDNGSSPYYLRTAHSCHAVNFVSGNGVAYDTCVNATDKGDWRGIRLNLQPINFYGELPLGFGKVDVDKHTIEFSYYPSALVGDSEQCETLLKSGAMVDTGVWYRGALHHGKFAKNKMYQCAGEYYVRVKQSGGNNAGTALWYQPRMITWKISDEEWKQKWKHMPKCINPKGDGSADYIDVYPEQLLDAGLPFYPDMFEEGNSSYLSSTLRHALNGTNGNKKHQSRIGEYWAEKGGDFSGHGFLQQISQVSLDVLQGLTGVKKQVINKNLKVQTQIKRPLEYSVGL